MGTSRTRSRPIVTAAGVVALGTVLALPAGAWGSAPQNGRMSNAPVTDVGEWAGEDRVRGARGEYDEALGNTSTAESERETAESDESNQTGELGPDTHESDDTQNGDAGQDSAAPDTENADHPDGGRQPETCEPLVTHTPQGSTGDPAAVVITSQSLEEGQPGWARVVWQAAEPTRLTEVHVVRDGETEHLTEGPLETGMREDVLELRFCGQVETADGEDPQGPGAPDPDSGTGGEDPATRPEGSNGTGGTAETGREPDGQPGDPDGPSGGQQDAPDQASGLDGEVEVLGLQLTADDVDDTEVLGTSLARTGVEVPALMATGAISALIGLLVLLRTRSRARRAH